MHRSLWRVRLPGLDRRDISPNQRRAFKPSMSVPRPTSAADIPGAPFQREVISQVGRRSALILILTGMLFVGVRQTLVGAVCGTGHTSAGTHSPGDRVRRSPVISGGLGVGYKITLPPAGRAP